MKTPNVYDVIEGRIYQTFDAEITKNCEDDVSMTCFSACETSKVGDAYDFTTVKFAAIEFTYD